ncbi:MAG: hypothetical protein CM15mP127_13970 [Gammaproteobacteria bacterium]|nr:MAG: hypothetical protein CM15mP127_13970 [Gammaproteobacteria bacterium]
MTTPVTQYASGNQQVMQFYLPDRFDQNNAPKPLNNSVEVASIKAGYFAVIDTQDLLQIKTSSSMLQF